MRCAAPIILLMCVHLSVADDATKSKTDQQIDAKLNAAEKLLNEVGILNDRVVRHLDAQRRALKTFRLSDSEIESLRVLSKGQFAKARQRFENAIGADARQFNRFYAGIACFDLGEYAKAKAHFKLAQKDKTCQPAATLMTLTSARCEVQPPKDDNAVISLFTEAIGELEAATAEAEPKDPHGEMAK